MLDEHRTGVHARLEEGETARRHLLRQGGTGGEGNVMTGRIQGSGERDEGMEVPGGSNTGKQDPHTGISSAATVTSTRQTGGLDFSFPANRA